MNGMAGTMNRNECIQSPRAHTEKPAAHTIGATSASE